MVGAIRSAAVLPVLRQGGKSERSLVKIACHNIVVLDGSAPGIAILVFSPSDQQGHIMLSKHFVIRGGILEIPVHDPVLVPAQAGLVDAGGSVVKDGRGKC